MAESALVARWRKLPAGIRYGAEGALVRLVIVAALTVLVLQVLEVDGTMASVRGNTSIPRVALTIPDFGLGKFSIDLTVEQMLISLVFTVLLGTAFSPWRAPTLLFSLLGVALLWVSFPYTRLSLNFLKAIPLFGGMFESFVPEPQDPPLLLLVYVAAGMALAVAFAAWEGARALRRAYDEKGTVKTDLRSLGSMQLAAAGIVTGVGLGTALLLGLAFQAMRGGLKTVSLPRVNPVLAFLVMGLSLALLIVAFAWKPKPADAPKTPMEQLRMSLQRDGPAK